MDLLQILWNSLYSKYKTNKTYYEIAQINSILFKSPITHATQYIKFRFKEMTITSNFEEYFQKYSYKDSVLKLKLLGFIYVNNFKPPPNYLSMGENIYNIMCKFLKEKQSLIERNIYNNIIKAKKYKNKYENAIIEKNNEFCNSKNFSKSSGSFLSNKNQSFDNKYLKEITNSKNHNKIIFFSLSKKYDESKYDEKNMNNIKENSTDSITRWIDQFKKRNININIIKNVNNDKNKNIINYNSKTKSEIKKFQENKIPFIRRNKMIFSTKPFFYNKNKIFEIIKNLKNEKIKGYRLSVDNFKEKMKKNRKSLMKEHIDNYWKTNKNFVTNLIENKNKINNNINYNQKSINKRYFSSNLNLSENSKNNINNSFNFNNFSLIKLPLSSKNIKPKYISLNKNNISRQRSKIKENSLIMKIQNDSEFMKNKNYSCAFPKENKIFDKFQDKKNSNRKHFYNKFRNKTKSNNNSNKQLPVRMMEAYSYTNYKFF